MPVWTPPATIATGKTNSTAQTTDHPAHHNALASAINEIVDVLGSDPSRGTADLTTLLTSLFPLTSVVMDPDDFVASPGEAAPLIVTETDGVLDFNVIYVPRTTDGTRGAIDFTAMKSAPGQLMFVIGQASGDGVSMGPSGFYDIAVPGYLYDLITTPPLGSYDFSGVNAQTPEFLVSGVNVPVPLTTDLVDGVGLLTAVATVLGAEGVTVAMNPNLLNSISAPGVAFRAPGVGPSSTISYVPASATGDLDTALSYLTALPGADYKAGPSASNAGNGDFGFSNFTHLWTDDSVSQWHHVSILISDGTDVYYVYRKMRPEEMQFTTGDSSLWQALFNNVPFNIGAAIDLIPQAVLKANRTVTGDTSIQNGDRCIGCNTAGGPIDVDLSGLTLEGREIVVDNLGSATNDVTLVGTVSGVVDPTIPDGESRTVYRGPEGLRFH